MTYNFNVQRYVTTVARHFHEYGFAMIPLVHETHFIVFASIGAAIFIFAVIVIARIEE